MDLNHRPLGYEPNELPGCSTPQIQYNSAFTRGQTRDGERKVTIYRGIRGPSELQTLFLDAIQGRVFVCANQSVFGRRAPRQVMILQNREQR